MAAAVTSAAPLHEAAPSPAPLAPGRLRGRELLLLALLALVLRVAAAVELSALPTLHLPVLDEARYEALARELLANGWWPREAFYQDPLYPYVVAAVYTVAGPRPGVVRLLQIVLSALTVPLLGAAAARLVGRRAGLAAGVLAAAYAPFLLWAPRLHKPTLLALASALALLALARAAEAGRERRLALLGVGLALGVAALLAGSLLLLVPVAALWAGATSAAGWRARFGAAALVAAGAAVAIAPATLVNFAHGEPALTATAGGVNFWIGNARGATGLFRPLGGGSQDPDSQALEAAALAAQLAPATPPRTATEVSRTLARAAWRDVAADPAAWVRLLLRKTRLALSGYEVPEAVSLAVDRETSRTLSVTPGWTLLAALGLPGLGLLLVRRRRAGALLAGLFVTATVGVVLFFVFGRFRQAAAPFLFPAAGAAVATLVAGATPRRTRVLLAGAVVATGALLAIPPFPPDVERQQTVAARFQLASRGLERAGNLLVAPTTAEGLPAQRAVVETELRRALAAYDAVLAIDPGFVVARAERGVTWLRLGTLQLESGNRAGARVAYAAAATAFDEVLADPRSAAVPELVPRVAALLPTLERNRLLAAADSP